MHNWITFEALVTKHLNRLEAKSKKKRNKDTKMGTLTLVTMTSVTPEYMSDE